MIIQGRTVSPGRAYGEARVMDPGSLSEKTAKASAHGSPAWEVERLHAAIGRAVVQLDRVNRQLAQRVGREDAAIFDTHARILRDEAFVNQIKTEIQQNGVSAETAVARVVQNTHQVLVTSPVPLVRDKAVDILDIGRRLFRCLQAVSADHTGTDPDAIIVTRELTPSELVRYAHQGVKAVLTGTCGPKSHTAILARSLGIPMLTAIEDAVERIAEGTRLFVDATEGKLYTGSDCPTAPVDCAERPKHTEHLTTPPTTADGARVALLLSISDAAEAESVRELGADGVGLWRIEFLFMDRTSWPTEDEIYQEFRRVAAQIGDSELSIRLTDFGAEKCPVYANIPVNRNPSLGLRGLRLLLQREDILRPQLGALLTLAQERAVMLLLPMLDSVETLEATIEKFRLIAGCRNSDRLPFQIGAMIEMPSVALMAGEIMEHVDAVSIGLNDLTQYTLAADRDDELVEAYHDPLHPAVIRLLRQVLEAAARTSKPVTVCGDLAGDIPVTAMLLALGVRRLSVSQTDFPKLARVIPQVSVASLSRIAEDLANARSGRIVRELVSKHLPLDERTPAYKRHSAQA